MSVRNVKLARYVGTLVYPHLLKDFDFNLIHETGIYAIYHIREPDKLYVGSCTSLKGKAEHHNCSRGFYKRWGIHIRQLLNKKHINPILQNYVNKYGIEGIRFSIVEVINNFDIVYEREEYYINSLKAYFNIVKNIEGKTRQSLEDLSLRQKGKINKGFKQYTDSLKRPTYKSDLFGNFICVYESANEASRCTGIDKGSIIRNCLKTSKPSKSGNFTWSYSLENIKPASGYILYKINPNTNQVIKKYVYKQDASKELGKTHESGVLSKPCNNPNKVYFGHKWLQINCVFNG